MTHMTMTSRGALLLSLLLVQGMAFAAPPSKHDDDIRISTAVSYTHLTLPTKA